MKNGLEKTKTSTQVFAFTGSGIWRLLICRAWSSHLEWLIYSFRDLSGGLLVCLSFYLTVCLPQMQWKRFEYRFSCHHVRGCHVRISWNKKACPKTQECRNDVLKGFGKWCREQLALSSFQFQFYFDATRVLASGLPSSGAYSRISIYNICHDRHHNNLLNLEAMFGLNNLDT